MNFNKKFVVMEIFGNSVKTLILKKKDRDNFTIVETLEIKEENTEKLKTALMNLSSKFNGSKVSLVFPRELMVLRSLPVSSPAADVVSLSVEKEIEEGLPFSKETALWDAEVVKGTVLLAATSKETRVLVEGS